jgi:hypothetical protein
MDKLFPIVRRVRRPLLPPDDEVSREEAKEQKEELQPNDRKDTQSAEDRDDS